MSGEDPFEKILKYIDEQRKMPHVATNIALKELTWPPKSRKADNPPKDLGATFPTAPATAPASPAPPPAPTPGDKKRDSSPDDKADAKEEVKREDVGAHSTDDEASR